MRRYILTHTAFPPKTKRQIKTERVTVIEKYLEDNLLRFLRRHYKQSTFELVYSKYIKKWRKNNPDLVKLLEKVLKDKNGIVWPRHMVEVVNIMRTLHKYYGYKLESTKTAVIALMIDDLFEHDIYMYGREHRQTLINNDLFDPKLVTREQALKEHKARGFIKANDFDDHDWRFAHVMSNLDRELMYPYNFNHAKTYGLEVSNVYIEIGLPLVGVQGYTRMVIPKN